MLGEATIVKTHIQRSLEKLLGNLLEVEKQTKNIVINLEAKLNNHQSISEVKDEDNVNSMIKGFLNGND